VARWEVAPLDGSPSVGARPLRRAGQIGAGEWIEADARRPAPSTSEIPDDREEESFLSPVGPAVVNILAVEMH